MPVVKKFERFVVSEQFRLHAELYGVPRSDAERAAFVDRIMVYLDGVYPTVTRGIVVDVVASLMHPAPVEP